MSWWMIQWWCQTIHQNKQGSVLVGLGTSQILIWIKMHTRMVRNDCLYGNDFWVVTLSVKRSQKPSYRVNLGYATNLPCQNHGYLQQLSHGAPLERIVDGGRDTQNKPSNEWWLFAPILGSGRIRDACLLFRRIMLRYPRQWPSYLGLSTRSLSTKVTSPNTRLTSAGSPGCQRNSWDCLSWFPTEPPFKF
jgi:hypothetical protein